MIGYPEVEQWTLEMANNQKYYSIDTAYGFQQLFEWMSVEIRDRRLILTGSAMITLDHIYSQHNDQQYNTCWKKVYDFSRTATVTLRHLMLKATGITPFFDTKLQDPARQRVVDDYENEKAQHFTSDGRPINEGNYLVANNSEANFLVCHFDMLLPYFLINDKLDNIGVGQTRTFNKQMIVVDFVKKVVWSFVFSLPVERKPLKKGDEKTTSFNFHAIPMINIYRLECQEGKQFNSLQPPPHPPNKEAIDKLTKLMDELKIEKKDTT